MKPFLMLAGVLTAASVSFAQSETFEPTGPRDKAVVTLGRVAIASWQRSEILNVNRCNLSSVRLRVVGVAALSVQDLVVTFGNGGMQTLQVRERFNPGQQSRWIDLNAGTRCVRSIYLRGMSSTGFIPSVVEFQGQTGPGTPGGQGQRLVTVTLRDQPTRATVPVNRCGLRQLRLQFGNQGGQISRFVVYFNNGGSQVLGVNGSYRAGQFSSWENLNGNAARCVSRIDVQGRSQMGGGNSALSIFGR